MKKIILYILAFAAALFAAEADVKPLVFTGVADQQAQYEYMLQYKLYGYEYLKIGQNDTIPDKSGWNGSEKEITMNHQVVLGGPILTQGAFTVGNGTDLKTGPVRAQSMTMGNDNGSNFAGNYCVADGVSTQISNIITRSEGKVSCDSVPAAPSGLQMPTLVFPDTTAMEITVPDRGKVYIDIPDEPTVDMFIKSITTGTEDTLYFRMKNKGTLTRVFVEGSISFGNHTVVQVVYASPDGDSVITQDKFRGNLMFYTQEDFNIRNTDYSKLQGTYISTKKINLISNIDFAGQLLANELEIGDNFSGKNFRFVKFNPDTLDFPELNKQGGLRENDSTVIIPIELSDTSTIEVFFTYCFDMKDGVTVEDFNQPPFIPVCGDTSITTKIPIGSKAPVDTIKVNVKVDTLVEPNEYLIMHIDSISGAVLPNGETSGELKIKIIDAKADTNRAPKFATEDTTLFIPENTKPGIIGTIAATDPNGDKLSYTILGTVPFIVDSVGNISSTREFDFEKEKQFTFKLVASDGKLTDTCKVTVKVTDVNEPVHAKDTTFSIDEGKVGDLGKITGEDEDGKPVKFTVNDTNAYRIDSTGILTLVTPFDYEKQKTDTVTVYVTDGTFTDSAIVIINIKNVNGNPELQPNDSLTVPENCKSCIVGIITATDPDNDPITYDVIQQGFTIDSNGVLKLTDPLDFETTPEVKITILAKDPNGGADTAIYVVKVTDINEPVHTKDTTCSVKENYTGKICKVTGTDEDKTTPTFIISDTTNYSIDSTGTITIKNPIDYEKKTKDTVKVIVTDGEFADTATIIIRVLDEPETVEITKWDDEKPKDTVKTNDPDHRFEWQVCEGDTCNGHIETPHIRKDTTIKVCNDKKTVCDSIVVLFNDAPPVVTLTNAKSTDAYIDYITIEEVKDDKIYVNKKDNQLTVTVKDTVHKTTKSFPIDVKLDTVHVSSKNIKDYSYLIDETLATYTSIGNGKFEKKEVIKDGDVVITLTQIVDKHHDNLDTVQTVTYTVKQDGKELTISYQTDNLTGTRVSDYKVAYKIDSCTTVSYYLDDNKKISKNKEGNIAYTVTYDYTDDFGNKASSKVDIIFDDIPPKVQILSPTDFEKFNSNAVNVKWTVNGEVQDTLTLQRLTKGVNHVVRRYVDKAGNVATDTVTVIMNEAKDIDISLVHPVTEVDQDKVDEWYSDSHNKYDPKKPYVIKTVDPKNDTLPDVIGVGFKVDIALPSVSPTGGLATLDDIVKNGQIPVDDKGHIVGASTKGIPVDQYVEEHCTEDFKKDYKKHGLNIPLYDVTYNMHLWIYTTQANYVNDFVVEYTLNDEDKATSAGTVQMVIDWLSDKDGNVKAKNHHSLGTSSYITSLYAKSVAKHRCDYNEQKKGDKTVKKDETMKVFGYKRPKK